MIFDSGLLFWGHPVHSKFVCKVTKGMQFAKNNINNNNNTGNNQMNLDCFHIF